MTPRTEVSRRVRRALPLVSLSHSLTDSFNGGLEGHNQLAKRKSVAGDERTEIQKSSTG